MRRVALNVIELRASVTSTEAIYPLNGDRRPEGRYLEASASCTRKRGRLPQAAGRICEPSRHRTGQSIPSWKRRTYRAAESG